jgi:hypothetical protein
VLKHEIFQSFALLLEFFIAVNFSVMVNKEPFAVCRKALDFIYSKNFLLLAVNNFVIVEVQTLG